MEVPVQPETGRKAFFGSFVFDRVSGELHRGTVRVKLQDLPCRALLLLIERPGEVISRSEMIARLWPAGTFVEFDTSLNAALNRLRYALGDSAENPVFIETLPRRGYRFIAPVRFEPALTIGVATGPVPTEPVSSPAERGAATGNATRMWIGIAAFACVCIVLAVTAVRFLHRKPVSTGSGRISSVAILPLTNIGAGPKLNYLRFSIAEDLANTLSSASSLSLRPFDLDASLAGTNALEAGKAMKVDYIVSGSFIPEQKDLRVTLEVTDVAADRVVWRGSSLQSADDLLQLHQYITSSATTSVVPAVHGVSPPPDALRPSANSRAFSLYFHSLGASRDPEPNKLVIASLQEAVDLDPGYAPAWGELAWRFYLDGQYSNGGIDAYRQARDATRRAIVLDPSGPYNSVILDVEQGQVYSAYREARDLLKRRPTAPESHYQMSVVLRYAGLLQEAATECDVAHRMDPTFFRFRSCFIVFAQLGQYQHAADYIRLDGSSSWANANSAALLLHQDKRTEAVQFAQASLSSRLPGTELLYAVATRAREDRIRPLAQQFYSTIAAEPDPEAKERAAELLSYAGHPELGLPLLKAAVDGQYCSFPVMDTEPMLANVRQLSGYPELRKLGTQCQAAFLARREAP